MTRMYLFMEDTIKILGLCSWFGIVSLFLTDMLNAEAILVQER